MDIFLEVFVVDSEKPLEVSCLCGNLCRSGLYPIEILIGSLRAILYSDINDTCSKCGQVMIGTALFPSKEAALAKAEEIRALVKREKDIRCLSRYRLMKGQLSKRNYDHNKRN